MWNDTDIPLAYLITFRCYGTWLHGDDRGSIDRFRNRYKSPYITKDSPWQQHNRQQLKGEPVTLNASRRNAVEIAIRKTCSMRLWQLHAVQARTNHVHSVVSIGLAGPDRALNAFKANATRQMRQDKLWEHQHSPWADKVASGVYGTRAVWVEQLTTCSTDKRMSCLTLMRES